jgi:hypothetical protein
LIIDDTLHVYTDDTIFRTSLTGFQAIAPALPRESNAHICSIYVLVNKDVFAFQSSQLKPGHSYRALIDARDPLVMKTDNFLFAVARHGDSFQLFDVPRRLSSVSFSGSVICAAASGSHIVVALTTSEIVFLVFENDIFDRRFTAPVESPPKQIAFYFQTLLIAFETSLRVAFVADGRLRYRHFVLAVPSPIASLVSNGFVWVIFADGRVATIVYEPTADQIQFLALSRHRRFTAVFPIDDLSAAVLRQDSVIFLRLKTDTFHGWRPSGVRDYAEIGALSLSAIATVCRIKNCIICFTTGGAAMGLMEMNSTAKFRTLLNLERTVRQNYQLVVSFSVNKGIQTSPGLVDLDILDSYRRLAVGEDTEDHKREIAELMAEGRSAFAF